jgi:hypothetical protein
VRRLTSGYPIQPSTTIPIDLFVAFVDSCSKIVTFGRSTSCSFRRELDVAAWFDNQEVTVKIPRIRIAWVMVAIAFLAIDFTVMRALLEYPSPMGEELLFGALPMANVLAVALVIAQQRPRSRPFLLGFELLGVIALASYIALALLFSGPREPIRFYVSIVLDPVIATMGQPHGLFTLPIIWLVVLLMLGWPQVAIALMGGYFLRRYKITITRR